MITFNRFAKIKTIESPEYLEFMKTVPPIVPGPDPVYHHIQLRGGAKSLKASDIFTVSLPFELHEGFDEAIHTIGPAAFQRRFNVDLKRHMLRNIEYFIANGGKF
jgi:hypothetical protein